MSIFGKSGGGADGASRIYQLRGDTEPTSIIDYTVSPNYGGAQRTGVFMLTGARTGDNLTVLLEERPYGDFVEPIIVIPSAFKYGVITVANRTFGGYFIVAEDSLSIPAYNEYFQLTPGVERIAPGLIQLSVLEKPTATGDRITELLSLTKQMQTVYSLSWSDKGAASYDAPILNTVLAPNQAGQLYMSSTPPYDVRVYSDRPVQLQLTIRTWDSQMKAWSQVSGEYLWTTQEDGSPDYNTIVTLTHLPNMDGFSIIPQGSRIELWLVAPQDPDTPALQVFDGTIGILGSFTQA